MARTDSPSPRESRQLSCVATLVKAARQVAQVLPAPPGCKVNNHSTLQLAIRLLKLDIIIMKNMCSALTP